MNIIHFTARAAFWKTTPDPPSTSLLTVTLCTLLTFCGLVADQYFSAGAGIWFRAQGINATLAVLLVTIVVTAAFVPPDRRATLIAAQMLLSCIEILVDGAFTWIRTALTANFPQPPMWLDAASTIVFLVALLVWRVGASVAIFRSLEPGRRRPILRACVLWIAVLVGIIALPDDRVFGGSASTSSALSPWPYISAYINSQLVTESAQSTNKGDDGASLDFAQPALLDAQLSTVSARREGSPNIFAIGIAGSIEQDVFLAELRGGLDVLSRTYPLDGHVVRLVNQDDTTKSFPVASRQNLAAAVQRMARVMDRDEDVLLLFVTSHGSPEGVALSMPGNINTRLSPDSLATLLDQSGIKNRIVIVSACFSGVFVGPLANDNTIIITAADESHSSFGCDNERDWTYFGDAFFNHGLRGSATLEDAFSTAKRTIAEWEARDGLTPSNPQSHFGAALVEKLRPLYRNASRVRD